MPQAKPQVWDESGRQIDWESLKTVYLVKLKIDVVALADSNLFGFFRGVENSGVGPHPEYLVLDVPDSVASNTVPGYCNSRRHRYSLHHVALVEIVAREAHVARLIFDSIGRLKLRLNLLESTMIAASRALAGV